VTDHSGQEIAAVRATSDINIDPWNEFGAVLADAGLESIAHGDVSHPRNPQPLGESLPQSFLTACSPSSYRIVTV
jgi:hypothetical protein